MKGTPWKKLTRPDLLHFDDIGREIILTAMDRGGIGKIGARGHCWIRHPNGVDTMSVTRSSNSRRGQNMRNDLNRLFPAPNPNGVLTKDEGQKMENPVFTDTELTKSSAPLPDLGTLPTDEEMLKCPAGMPAKRACDKEFATGGALYSHIRDDHAMCEWEGPDVEHDNPDYRCDLGVEGQAFVGTNRQSVAGHVNIQHKGNKPWEARDNSDEARSAAARKGAATRARHSGKTPTPVLGPQPDLSPVAEVMSAPTAPSPLIAAKEFADAKVAKSNEHRGLPSGAVKHQPKTPAAILAAIRELLGEDPQVAKLKAEVDDLNAQLELIADALHLNTNKKKK